MSFGYKSKKLSYISEMCPWYKNWIQFYVYTVEGCHAVITNYGLRF